MILFFIILATFIAISIIYAAFHLVKDERAFRKYERKRQMQGIQALKDISTTCNKINNGTNDNETTRKLTGELEATRHYLEIHY